VDPRFTRTSAVADLFCQIRAGSDIAFLGGVINYAIQNNRIAKEYLVNFTNAAFVVKATSSCPPIPTASSLGLTPESIPMIARRGTMPEWAARRRPL